MKDLRPFSALPLRCARFIVRKSGEYWLAVFLRMPYFHFVANTNGNGNGCSFRIWFFQKVLGFNRGAYWPVDFRSKVNQWKHVCVGIDSAPGLEPGCYIQGIGKIFIGDYVRIAANVGLVSANHAMTDLRRHERAKLRIGSYSWIGMNSVILPDVELGDFTVVAAGSVVTKSFPEGHCVIGGNPAIEIKKLDPNSCVRYSNEWAYNGYIPADRFSEYREKNLWV